MAGMNLYIAADYPNGIGGVPEGGSAEPERGGAHARQGEVMARITTGLVHLHSRYYGKGPTKAKTYFVNDTVICILQGGFTTVERTLIDGGNADAVYAIRRSFQEAMQGEFTAVVEAATGRKVIGYMSQIHADPDLAVEIFMLQPGGEAIAAYVEHDLAELEGEPGESVG